MQTQLVPSSRHVLDGLPIEWGVHFELQQIKKKTLNMQSDNDQWGLRFGNLQVKK